MLIGQVFCIYQRYHLHVAFMAIAKLANTLAVAFSTISKFQYRKSQLDFQQMSQLAC